jgi:glycosyltransferase involved in cell wall biosynthesis
MKPHIVIDARLYGPKHTGLGRYTKNLLVALTKLPDFSENKFTLLVYPELLNEIRSDLGSKYIYYSTTIRHYSISEQLFLPQVLYSLKPDLVHFTHLDKPILYFGRSVVTVHDLIRHFSRGKDTTTRSKWLYWPKYIGYKLMSSIALQASYIIVPSNFWRDYILKHYHIVPERIITTYEAVDPKFLDIKNTPIDKPDNYILYTGNLYPHKNIDVIFKALKLLPNIKLKIICARDVFANRSQKLAHSLDVANQVEFLGYIPDDKFSKLYSHALALVHPALLEGFSLTGLEAMALNCPVIASTASCLPEIYGNSVLYFDPLDPLDLVKQIKMLTNNQKLRFMLLKSGHEQVAKYSWQKTASKTLSFYQRLLS